jgi:chemotaxis signal transduction protein
MSDAENTHDFLELDLLLFAVGGVSFGVDAEQVEGIFSWQGEGADGLAWFHRELGYVSDTITYRAPSVLKIKTEAARNYLVIIDMLQDVTRVVAGDIHPFPSLVEPLALNKGMWGVVVKDDRMILLVDFQRLMRERNSD